MRLVRKKLPGRPGPPDPPPVLSADERRAEGVGVRQRSNGGGGKQRGEKKEEREEAES